MEQKKEEQNSEEVRICKLLGGDIEGDYCRIPLKFYRSSNNCSEMFGRVSKEGSCDIKIEHLIRLKSDNKYTDK